MADVNLIPPYYLNAQLVRRRLLAFAFATASLAVIVAGARAMLVLGSAAESRQIAQLEREGKVTSRARAQADALRRQKQNTERQLDELDTLRGGNGIRLFVEAFDNAHSDEIWLDELRYYRTERPVPSLQTPASAAASRANLIVVPAQAPAQPALPPAGEQRIEVVGHGSSHARLAQVMRTLGSQPGIAEVRLMSTGPGTYRDRPVVDFTLMVVMNPAARSRSQ